MLHQVTYNGQAFKMHLVQGTNCWTSSRNNASAIQRRREAEHAEVEASLRSLRRRMLRNMAVSPLGANDDRG